MRVGTDVWAGNEMLAVADRTGHLDASMVRRVEFSSNQEVLRALRNGIIEAGALMLDETLLAMDDGGDLVALAALDSSIGSDAVLGAGARFTRSRSSRESASACSSIPAACKC